MTAQVIKASLDEVGSPTDAEFLQRFFKTGKGAYGEGDIFIGVRMPVVRKIASAYNDLPLAEIEELLDSPIHEHRMTALVIMVNKAKKASEDQLEQLYDLYLRRTDRINNWDLVDISCPNIVGKYLFDKPKQPLYKLAQSKDLWERRIAIISTAYFIRTGQNDDTFKLAGILMDDTHDLIHKAVGWMLREAGKKDEARLKLFLDKHASTMPRTMLRYSIEKLHSKDKIYFMQKNH